MQVTPLDIVHPVHVKLWLVRLAPVGAVDDTTLDATERARAARFRFEADRSRYIRRRIALRKLLGKQLGLPADTVPLRLGENDKPELDMAQAPHFNASHHGELSLVGICDHAPIGVDIEGLRGWTDIDSLAQMNLTPAELADYRRLSPEHRETAFLNVWTRKEACLKAVGTGLAIELTELQTSLAADAREVVVPTDAGTRRVHLSSHVMTHGLMAAVATVCG